MNKYWCRRCKRNHTDESVIGQRHFFYAVETQECDTCDRMVHWHDLEQVIGDISLQVCEDCMDQRLGKIQ